MQVLFLADIRRLPADDAIETFRQSLAEDEHAAAPVPDPFMEELVRGTAQAQEEIDRRIAAHSENWRLERMPLVDRNILRLAVYEMTALGTPPAVVIDEALQLTRRFSAEEAVAFVNGVLDAVYRSMSGAQTREASALLPNAEGGKDPV